MSTRDWRVVRAPEPPADLDHPDAWAVLAYSEIEHDREAAVWGWTDQWAPPWVLLGALRHQEHSHKVLLAAVPADGTGASAAAADAVDGTRAVAPADVAGVVLVTVPRDDRAGLAWASPVVRAGEHAGRVTDVLLDGAERLARELGRTTLAFTTPHSPEPGPGRDVLEPPTGVGRVPATAPEVRVALDRGYALEQVARHSTLHLPVPAATLDALGRDARAAAGYRTHTWRDEIPAERLDDVAVLWTRMSTDAPSAGLDQHEERWDAARVRDHLADLADRFQHVLVTVAEDVTTGALVAFTVLQVPRAEVPFGFQEDTLVLREHRGHRLGTLVKVVNLRALAAWRPDVARLHTWNAQENAHMLAINVALGFRADGVAAVWQKRLA